MKAIRLSGGKKTLVDDADYDRLILNNWTAHQSQKDRWYVRSTSGSHPYMHRIILSIDDPKTQIDHINGDGLDNRRSNLRICNQSQNNANRKGLPFSSSIFKGVHFAKHAKRWRAMIKVNQRSIHIGYFRTEREAALAYDTEAKKHYAEFAHLNF